MLSHLHLTFLGFCPTAIAKRGEGKEEKQENTTRVRQNVASSGERRRTRLIGIERQPRKVQSDAEFDIQNALYLFVVYSV